MFIYDNPDAMIRAERLAQEIGADLRSVETTRISHMWRVFRSALVFQDGQIEYLDEGTEKEIELWMIQRVQRWKNQAGAVAKKFVLCQSCLRVEEYSDEKHMEEVLCVCGGVFCGCPRCQSEAEDHFSEVEG